MAGSRRWAIIACAAVAAGLLTPLLLLAAVDAGLLDRAIERIASVKAHRAIRFRRLEAHLLSAHPALTVEELSIGSPPGITREPLLRAPLLTARLRLSALLAGRFAPIEMTLTRPQLHLVRIRPGVNNYDFGGGGASGFLQGTRSLVITDAAVNYEDIQRGMTLTGIASQQGRPGEAYPFQLAGAGIIKGGAYTVVGQGAALNDRPAGAPYPFHARLVDGRAVIELSGTSRKPFDFGGVDLAVRASGPNLVVLGDVLGLSTPNSRPFALSGRARRAGRHLVVSDLVARIGRSDVRGEILADREPGRPTRIDMRLNAQDLYLRDIRALLRARPPHAVARALSGDAQPTSRGGLSTAPFRARVLATTKATIDLMAARVPDAPVPVRRLVTRVTWEGGGLVIAPLAFDTAPGLAQLAMRLDLARPLPSFAATGALRAARIAVLSHGLGQWVDGDMDVFLDLHGQGRSPRAMADDTAGRLALRVSHGQLQRARAAVLGGDLIKAIETALGDKAERLPLDCAVGEFAAADGRFHVSRLDIVTAAGVTSGGGDFDLRTGALRLVLKGTPSGRPLVRLSPPIVVSGSLARPKVGLAPAQNASRGPLPRALATITHSVAAIVSPPPVPAVPSCATLLPEAGRYVASGAVRR
jgi:AsmA family protein